MSIVRTVEEFEQLARRIFKATRPTDAQAREADAGKEGHPAIRDPAGQRDVVAGMLDALRERLGRLAPADQDFVVVDTRAVLLQSGELDMDWWQDEIHPASSGFRRVARSIVARLKEHGLWIGE